MSDRGLPAAAGTAPDLGNAFARLLTRFGAKLCLSALLITGAGLVLMTAMVAWGVFGRYILNETPIWVEAGSLVLMAWFILLGSAVGVRESDPLGVEVGLAMSQPLRRVLIITTEVTVLSGLLLCVSLMITASAVAVRRTIRPRPFRASRLSVAP